MIKKKYYILIYSRISTSEQKFNTSIKNQIKSIKRHFYNYSNIEIFSDIQSGSKNNRKGYNNMLIRIVELQNDNFKVIIGVYKLDRLHRSLLNLIQFINFIKKKDIGLISITESFDLFTPQGKLFIQMLGSFAEFERELIKERMINGKIYKLNSNSFIGGRIPFGYRYDKKNKTIMIDENRSLIIKEIFKLKKKGFSYYRINLMMKDKYPNENIYYSKIRRILNHKIYFGIKKQNILKYSKKMKIIPILSSYWRE